MGSQQSYQVNNIPVSWSVFKKACSENDNIEINVYRPQNRGYPKKKPTFNYVNNRVWVMNYGN